MIEDKLRTKIIKTVGELRQDGQPAYSATIATRINRDRDEHYGCDPKRSKFG